MATAQKTTSGAADAKSFSAEEKAAMRERARELKAEARSRDERAEGERDLLAKIAEMNDSDRTMAERLHAAITKAAPELAPKTWYGMPAWAREGRLVCFFKPAAKFSSRYATFGFEEAARLDEGTMWTTSFALTKLTPADEAKLVALVKKAVG